jgi:hypothetical protein
MVLATFVAYPLQFLDLGRLGSWPFGLLAVWALDRLGSWTYGRLGSWPATWALLGLRLASEKLPDYETLFRII